MPRGHTTIFLITTLLILLTQPPPALLCHLMESSALLRFKHSIGKFLFSGELSSWQGNGSDCCRWQGITCDSITGFVIQLQISFVTFGYIGSIDPSLFELKQLQLLDLSKNWFNGSIPKRLVELTHLTHLDLSFCRFTGQIPGELLEMTWLISLNLSRNLYDGSPLQLQRPNFTALVRRLDQLQHLQLEGVEVSMSGRDVSTTLLSSPSLQKLKTLSLSKCNISGPLLDEPFLYMQSLSHLNLSFNNLQGLIPEGLCSLSHVTILSLSNSSLNGTIPMCFSRLSSLVYLNIFYNHLSGSIPSSLFTLPSLKFLDLRYNRLNGSLPKFYIRSSNLTFLFLDNNLLSGDISFFIYSLPSLKVASLSSNNFTSMQSFPTFICKPGKLQHLDLSSNNRKGKISYCLWGFTDLTHLILDHNKLDGFQEPTNTTRVIGARLSLLSVSSNRINGLIPTFLCHYVAESATLDMSSNALTGAIPNCLCKVSKLNLSSNQLQGQIPNVFNNIQLLDFNSNILTGTIPKSIASSSTSLTVLNLGNNKLEDAFPGCLGRLTKLKVLILRSNHLYRPIIVFANSLQAFPVLKIFDISNNYFSGTLPHELFEGFKAMMHNGSEDDYIYQNVLFPYFDGSNLYGIVYLHGEIE